MKTALQGKPFRSMTSTFSTYRHSEKASLPFKLKIECSSLCNIQCEMCPHNPNVGLKRKKGVLKFENFKKIFDEINPAYLNLTGIGEPFLNKDLFKIVRYAKNKKTMVKLDTNATLLTQENIDKILSTKIDIISTSIDGATKDSYEKIRKGANFNTLKVNVKKLIKSRNKNKSKTKIHMFFVLQENNLKDLPKFIELAEELGVDYLAGSFVVTLGMNNNEENKLLKIKRETKEILSETKKLLKKSKIEVSIDSLLRYLETNNRKHQYNKEKPCYMPWYSTFITWDGKVNPCDFS
ncbi:MAG: radical SAM protein, partial [Candidatus Pacearchaeota archaeon]|nr:radical SAM protein [Candidatus Pacearchaeota archaeon]